MRIHHLSCGSMCPYGGGLWDGVTAGLGPATIVCHCLLIETEQGLVLVDTGFGLRDVAQPTPRLSPLFLTVNRIRLRAEETARHQIAALGLDPADVRHIVLTHLDFDHAGGIEDFPQATVHVMEAELAAAAARRSLLDRGRYRPMQWDENVKWRRYRPDGERWFGFDSVRAIDGLPPEILFVPLAGHTTGHAGIAIRLRHSWLLHAGDAYFYEGEMDMRGYRCTPMMRFYQKMMEVDRGQRLANQHRLRELKHAHGGEVELFCAHDRKEFDRMAAASPVAVEPAAA
ncbi:MAG: MBL fold metallo-hydrolase [Alphaproteobacteria bacterium]|nr:MBL fold metallo-hydrolase [Alphaproteobacteria bacterium]